MNNLLEHLKILIFKVIENLSILSNGEKFKTSLAKGQKISEANSPFSHFHQTERESFPNFDLASRGYFTKFCGLLRIYELYQNASTSRIVG